VYWVLVALMAACALASAAWGSLIGHDYTDPSVSMDNTVRPGDTLLADDGRGVRRGDVIILSLPPGRAGGPAGEIVVRRVIGLPGDRVACCTGGRVTVNGKPLDETYVYPGDEPSVGTFATTLGPGQLWVLGDHRSVAVDSRLWGPVPVGDVTGRVVAEGSGAPRLLRTPQAFVTAGLAPPDGRTPWILVPLAVGSVAVPVLVLLVIFGLVRTLIRKRQRRRSIPTTH
jgi:signal peptidase I